LIKAPGKCRLDQVQVVEGSFNVFGPAPVLTAKYALSSSDSEVRLGPGTRNQGWSPETMQRLQALVESMERDICSEAFEDTTNSCVTEDDLGTSDGVPGF
jgi:hypothetical protein